MDGPSPRLDPVPGGEGARQPGQPPFASFREFYPFYLSEHADPRCRRMHFVGTTLVLVAIGVAIATRNPWWLIAAPIAGYAFAWAGTSRSSTTGPRRFATRSTACSPIG
jgi:hypothetical protein